MGLLGWRLGKIGEKVWGFVWGKKKDAYFRRYENENGGRWNKLEQQSDFNKGKSLLVLSGLAIPSVYLYQNIKPRLDINFGAISDWARDHGIAQGLYNVYDALSSMITKEQAKGKVTFTEYHRVEEIYMWLKNLELANKHRMNLIKIGTTHEVKRQWPGYSCSQTE